MIHKSSLRVTSKNYHAYNLLCQYNCPTPWIGFIVRPYKLKVAGQGRN